MDEVLKELRQIKLLLLVIVGIPVAAILAGILLNPASLGIVLGLGVLYVLVRVGLGMLRRAGWGVLEVWWKASAMWRG